ncbi:M15 family metallopeptidase [Gracilibacillus sp. S3-1-1]|uniref:M15 family metallopeptidase n=1 Tax=Gracilibacillus pellucidus TaxID=3095368 RepID=A0ACC6M3Z6_9BACI|nr:M15 family metallopeptidase [Gracilibacillus sp. S3-1-1]MDX8045688.1 M15 family metallopeptidase [Gracilibacillus sp. S3-1-1]
MKKIVLLILMSIVLFGCQQNEQVAKQSEKKVDQVEHKDDADSVVEEEPNEEQQNAEEPKEEASKQEKKEEKENKKEDSVVEVDNPDDTLVVVNRQRKLAEGYIPEDLTEANIPYYAEEGDPKRLVREVVVNPLEDLFEDAELAGLDLVAVSGYRSYDRQKEIYDRNVAQRGKEETDKFSAQPGASEHQTGLAMDVSSAQQVALEQSFSETNEGQWLADHAHEHGFIIRYLEGKEDITGYSYEPWHIRYVGKEAAKEIYQQQITLEEYLGLDE